MTYSAGAVAVSAAAVAAQKAYVGGVIIVLSNDEFLKLVRRLSGEEPVIIHGIVGTFSKHHVYVIPHKGVVYVTKSKDPLPVTPGVEAKKLYLSGNVNL